MSEDERYADAKKSNKHTLHDERLNSTEARLFKMKQGSERDVHSPWSDENMASFQRIAVKVAFVYMQVVSHCQCFNVCASVANRR